MACAEKIMKRGFREAAAVLDVEVISRLFLLN